MSGIVLKIHVAAYSIPGLVEITLEPRVYEQLALEMMEMARFGVNGPTTFATLIEPIKVAGRHGSYIKVNKAKS